MEIITISAEIEKRIKLLESMRISVRDRGQKKAECIAEYEKKLAVTIIQLKNGKEFELDGTKILNPLTTITEKIAKGICWEEKLEMEKSESLYKSAIINIETVSTELNAFQSLFRHLDKA